MKAFLLNIKQRLLCHWITSLIGVILFVIGIVLAACSVISFEAFCYVMPAVLPLFFSKDSWLISLYKKPDADLKIIFIILLAAAALWLLSGCYTREKCNKLFPPQVTIHDSINTVYLETVHDTTITIPADSSWLRAWLKCDSAGNVYVSQYLSSEGQSSSLQWELKNNVLYILFQKNAYELRLQLKDKLIKYYRDRKITIEHTTNILKPWQKTLLWVAGSLTLIFLIVIITIIYKFFKHGKTF